MEIFGLKCDEEKHPVIDGHAFCRQCKNNVAARNGNTLNLIAHLRNNHPTLYADFTKQKAEKAKQHPSNKSAQSNYQSQRRLLAANLTIKKQEMDGTILIQSHTVL